MAERRMFAKSIVFSDDFLDMPLSTRNLYFSLNMVADDDGFVNRPKMVMRAIGAAQDDLSILCAKSFVIPFESGVLVIKHWKIHNFIRKDRYKETEHLAEKSEIETNENGEYSLVGQPTDNQMTTSGIPRLGKDRLGKDRLGESSLGDAGEENASSPKRARAARFTPPSISDISDYCRERRNAVDPERFFDHYESNGWMVGKTKMKDWKASVRNWERNERGSTNAEAGGNHRESQAGEFDEILKGTGILEI